MIKEKFAAIVKEAINDAVESKQLGQLTVVDNDIWNGIVIDRAKKPEFGDYCCNISYLARHSRMAPPKIADILAKIIEPKTNGNFTVSVMAGFINFTLTNTWLNETVAEILTNRECYGSGNYGNGMRVNLEYVSANPTGPLHIGHGRWAALGSSIANIMKFTGYDVTQEFYINDAGVQINNLGYSLFLRALQQDDDSIYFPNDVEKDPRTKSFYPGEYLVDIAKQFNDARPGRAKELKETCSVEDNLLVPSAEIIKEFADFAKPLILEQQKELLANFQTTFDVWYSETALHESGKVDNILGFLDSKDALCEKDGAIWFKSSAFLDDQDRVIRKSDGKLTYLTADIAYHKDKYDRGFEHLINIWGADHHGYVPRMKSAVQAMGFSPDSLEVIIGQMVNLVIDGDQVRMGKRKRMYTLDELIEEVGVDATRYWMVSRSTDSTLDFDVDLAKSSSDENPVFYVQYAHARCCSIIRTATSDRVDVENKKTLEPLYTEDAIKSVFEAFKSDPSLLNPAFDAVSDKEKASTKALILEIENFKDLVFKASRDKSPHYLATYLITLARTFHSFYNDCRVLDLNPSNPLPEGVQDARIVLVDATRQILYNGVRLLGVNAPQSM